MIDIKPMAYWFMVTRRKDNASPVVEFLRWNNLSMELRMKYDWYFKYRAALMQVQHPRERIESSWGTMNANGRTLEKSLRDRIKAKKAKITHYKNLLRKAVEEDMKTLRVIPVEDTEDFKKAEGKIKQKEFELLAMQKELEELTK